MAKVRAKVTTKHKDLGWKQIQARIKAMGTNPHVVVGVRGESALASKKTHDDKTGPLRLVDVATIHEYGSESRNIPERSFLRATMKQNLNLYRRMTVKLWNQLLDPKKAMPVTKILAILGEKIKLDVQERIRNGIAPPWSERTLAERYRRSGGIVAVTPLIDTGQLVGSISYEVREDKV